MYSCSAKRGPAAVADMARYRNGSDSSAPFQASSSSQCTRANAPLVPSVLPRWRNRATGSRSPSGSHTSWRPGVPPCDPPVPRPANNAGTRPPSWRRHVSTTGCRSPSRLPPARAVPRSPDSPSGLPGRRRGRCGRRTPVAQFKDRPRAASRELAADHFRVRDDAVGPDVPKYAASSPSERPGAVSRGGRGREDEHCAAIGRDPRTITRSVQHIVSYDDPAGHRPEDHHGAHRAAGVTHIVLSLRNLCPPQAVRGSPTRSSRQCAAQPEHSEDRPPRHPARRSRAPEELQDGPCCGPPAIRQYRSPAPVSRKGATGRIGGTDFEASPSGSAVPPTPSPEGRTARRCR